MPVENGAFEDGGGLTATADISGKIIAGTRDFVSGVISSKDTITANVTYRDGAAALTAPIAAGDEVGTVTYTCNGAAILTAALTADNSVDEIGNMISANPSESPLIFDPGASDTGSPWLFWVLIAVAILAIFMIIRIIILRSNRRRRRRRRGAAARSRTAAPNTLTLPFKEIQISAAQFLRVFEIPGRSPKLKSKPTEQPGYCTVQHPGRLALYLTQLRPEVCIQPCLEESYYGIHGAAYVLICKGAVLCADGIGVGHALLALGYAGAPIYVKQLYVFEYHLYGRLLYDLSTSAEVTLSSTTTAISRGTRCWEAPCRYSLPTRLSKSFFMLVRGIRS